MILVDNSTKFSAYWAIIYRMNLNVVKKTNSKLFQIFAAK